MRWQLALPEPWLGPDDCYIGIYNTCRVTTKTISFDRITNRNDDAMAVLDADQAAQLGRHNEHEIRHEYFNKQLPV